MIIKSRSESDELKILRSLNIRTTLKKKEKDAYFSAEKGYEGEVRFDERADPLVKNMVFLNDVLLEQQGSEIQIDSLAVASKTIFHFEVKNFEGDFIIDKGEWRSPGGIVIKNPLLQVSRAGSMLRQLSEQSGYNYPVESYLVFVNPEFHLDNPPAKTPHIVYPTQIARFIKNLQNRPLNASKSDIRLGEKFLSLHKESSSYSRLPEYRFEDLRKGIVCPGCLRFYQEFNRKILVCSHCARKENCERAILRTIEEFKLLFPNFKVTNQLIYEVCGGLLRKKTIYRALSTNYKKEGYGKHAVYIE
ncbi:nuclease-related domain-containing protein [Bacillus sp. SCS-153A]|uniref:nuclease-related domain-containing protein n=1 Tax=Rossellomorea sedimentorum TaxID=3115294 RepID=UPI0039057F9B